jgi:hypothetical protein
VGGDEREEAIEVFDIGPLGLLEQRDHRITDGEEWTAKPRGSRGCGAGHEESGEGEDANEGHETSWLFHDIT